jgi:uncharacterized membrane protein YozB (DUF420 family)
MTLAQLPALNAMLNATSAVLLIAGMWSIGARRVGLHVVSMMGAVAVSALFLASYLIYHAQMGSVHFQGSGWIRPVYFAILGTHTVLAAVIVPLVGRTVFLAVRRRYEAHKAFARWTLPIWLYVSLTGVVIYWLLYRSPWSA